MQAGVVCALALRSSGFEDILAAAIRTAEEINLSIPDYQTIMLPLLQLTSDGQEHRFRDAVETLAEQFHLTDSERAQMIPSGVSPVFNNRAGWARTYLKQAGLLRAPKRGWFQITDAGQALLRERPARIDVALLDRYEAFRDFRSRRRASTDAEVTGTGAGTPETINHSEPSAQTPEDALAAAYATVRGNVEAEVLDLIKAASPAFFERVVIDLLVANRRIPSRPGDR